MKIIAKVPIGRYGTQFAPGDALDVSPRDAALYVASRQAVYAPDDSRQRSGPAAGPEVTPDGPSDETASGDEDRPRKGRYRRRDMKAEDDGA